MAAHSHDGIDWAAWLERLRKNDDLYGDAYHEVADRLVRPTTRVVVDVGSGAGGMGAAFARAMSATGGTVVLVDSAPELLDAAAAHASAAAGKRVEIRTVQADAAGEELPELAPRADLVFASFVVHHLPDEQGGIDRLAALVNPGGRFALVEGGLQRRCLPWDVGVGEPGLQDRLLAARDEWFRHMRAGMDGAVRLPVGWNRALTGAGLVDVGSFSYLIDRPAPPTDDVREAAVRWLSGLRETAEEWISEPDRRAADQLLDPYGPHYLGLRDDVFLLAAHTVYLGTAR